jgi:hypothetical protein
MVQGGTAKPELGASRHVSGRPGQHFVSFEQMLRFPSQSCHGIQHYTHAETHVGARESPERSGRKCKETFGFAGAISFDTSCVTVITLLWKARDPSQCWQSIVISCAFAIAAVSARRAMWLTWLCCLHGRMRVHDAFTCCSDRLASQTVIFGPRLLDSQQALPLAPLSAAWRSPSRLCSTRATVETAPVSALRGPWATVGS